MTNPNNAVGTNAAYSGRTSVNAFNDGLAGYESGILKGWGCVPKAGLTVSLGGNGTDRDVAIAEDNIGDKVTVNNISGSAVDVTLGSAPASNSRIDLIVAYVDNPPQGASTAVDNPGACGIIPVAGTAAATPVAPNESAIRSAITADGASGTTAYYVVLAQVTLASGTTDITSDMIRPGTFANRGEVFISKVGGDGSFTLPAGYTVYHIRGHVRYSTSPQQGYIGLALTSNKPGSGGNPWLRRMKFEKETDPLWQVSEFQLDNASDVVYVFGSGQGLGTFAGSVWFDITVQKETIDPDNAGVYTSVAIGEWHHSMRCSSGLTTSEFRLADYNAATGLQFIGDPDTGSTRTFHDADIVITGVKE